MFYLFGLITYIAAMRYVNESSASTYGSWYGTNLCDSCMERGICKISENDTMVFKCESYFKDIYIKEDKWV